MVHYLHEMREDILLNVLSWDESLEVYALLGQGHSTAGTNSFHNYNYSGKCFLDKDNISAWNKSNPDHTYSIIELTPYGVE